MAQEAPAWLRPWLQTSGLPSHQRTAQDAITGLEVSSLDRLAGSTRRLAEHLQLIATDRHINAADLAIEDAQDRQGFCAWRCIRCIKRRYRSIRRRLRPDRHGAHRQHPVRTGTAGLPTAPKKHSSLSGTQLYRSKIQKRPNSLAAHSRKPKYTPQNFTKLLCKRVKQSREQAADVEQHAQAEQTWRRCLWASNVVDAETKRIRSMSGDIVDALYTFAERRDELRRQEDQLVLQLHHEPSTTNGQTAVDIPDADALFEQVQSYLNDRRQLEDEEAVVKMSDDQAELLGDCMLGREWQMWWRGAVEARRKDLSHMRLQLVRSTDAPRPGHHQLGYTDADLDKLAQALPMAEQRFEIHASVQREAERDFFLEHTAHALEVQGLSGDVKPTTQQAIPTQPASLSSLSDDALIAALQEAYQTTLETRQAQDQLEEYYSSHLWRDKVHRTNFDRTEFDQRHYVRCCAAIAAIRNADDELNKHVVEAANRGIPVQFPADVDEGRVAQVQEDDVSDFDTPSPSQANTLASDDPPDAKVRKVRRTEILGWLARIRRGRPWEPTQAESDTAATAQAQVLQALPSIDCGPDGSVLVPDQRPRRRTRIDTYTASSSNANVDTVTVYMQSR